MNIKNICHSWHMAVANNLTEDANKFFYILLNSGIIPYISKDGYIYIRIL
jgi:hypothetical protein